MSQWEKERNERMKAWREERKKERNEQMKEERIERMKTRENKRKKWTNERNEWIDEIEEEDRKKETKKKRKIYLKKMLVLKKWCTKACNISPSNAPPYLTIRDYHRLVFRLPLLPDTEECHHVRLFSLISLSASATAPPDKHLLPIRLMFL